MHAGSYVHRLDSLLQAEYIYQGIIPLLNSFSFSDWEPCSGSYLYITSETNLLQAPVRYMKAHLSAFECKVPWTYYQVFNPEAQGFQPFYQNFAQA